MSPQYQRFGRACAVFGGIIGLLYSGTFDIVSKASHHAGSLRNCLFLWPGFGLPQQRVRS